MAEPSAFETALFAAMRPDVKSFVSVMGPFTRHRIETAADAAAVVRAIDLLPADPPPQTESLIAPAFGVIGLFQKVASVEAATVLQGEGIPRLCEFYDRRAAHPDQGPDVLLECLRAFARYGTDGGIGRLLAAIARPLAPDSYFWTGVFKSVRKSAAGRLLGDLRRSPPSAGTFLAVVAMDFATARRISGIDEPHLFDTDAGVSQLEAWVLDAARVSYGVSAAATLAFITHPNRDGVLALALDHLAVEVQLEAAWVAARLGRRSGVDLLARWATDPRHAAVATRHLEELGRADAIPDAARTPAARAAAEMSRWLSSGFEAGRPPDAIEVYDHRELFWPPTNDRRPVWLFRYTYRDQPDGKPDVVGIGMVGSVTFGLFGDATADLPADDVYALHCCWELRMNKDPRTPAARTVEAGRDLLRRAGNE